MKFALLSVLVSCLTLSGFCQSKDVREKQNFFNQILKYASQRTKPHRQLTNIDGPGIKAPASLLSPAAYQRQGVNHQLLKNDLGHPNLRRRDKNARISELCKDTSFRHLIGVTNGYVYVQSAAQLRDGNMLVSLTMYDSTIIPNTFWKSYGLLIKLDGDGEVVWLKQFENLETGSVSFFYGDRTYELSNGDIICTGLLNSDGNSDVFTTAIYRLNSTGDIIWQNRIKNNIGIFNSSPGSFTFYSESATEGLNGDLIICGTTNSNLSSGKIATVIRLNSLGQLVWDANFGNHDLYGSYHAGAEGINAFVQNGQIIMTGLSHGSNYPLAVPAISFFTLDYNNGNVLSKRFFRPDYADDDEETLKGFTYWSNKCIRLSSGHFLFYGKLFSDIVRSTPVKDHFGVVEFDGSFNLVNSYTISSELISNYYNNVLHFDQSGRGLVSVFEFISAYTSNIFFGAFSNQQFQNQRKSYYANSTIPPGNGFAWMNDNGYAFVQTDLENPPNYKSYFEFRKMHNSDTSSECLGRDTMLMHFLPLNIIEDPAYYMWDDNDPNKILTLPVLVSQTDTTTTSSLNPCRQTNFCDTVKIHGSATICGASPALTFTAFKNIDCGATVQWDIAPGAIDSLHVLSDTSVTIWFKNINWQGQLHAILPPGACYSPSQDSMPLSIIRLQQPINLGADTVICSPSSLLLHAGNTFANYLWQDGNTDSVYTVTTPGIYWVRASDFCGNNFIDSITVMPFTESINIGPDRIKCNDDTLHLVAPPGFLNYTWGPAYNIKSQSGQQAIVQPTIDTSYFIKAEKTPGCFVYDTLRINVNVSAPIFLGPDKSFCAGDSMMLNGGNGFAKYFWSNGDSSQQIFVYTSGDYLVRGTAANGCSSYDTLKITTWSNPVINLNDDPVLCAGSVRKLVAGTYSAYLWQDGSSASSFTVSDTGVYYVKVWDNNQCSSSDTIHIMRLIQPPVNFLPADTAICKYGTLVIQSRGNYKNYNWSSNSSSSFIKITTPGIYWLQVTDASDCTGKDSIIVNSKDCLTGFNIPTAFTPDGNGVNDYFKPFITGVVKQYEFTIYNRWGQAVFTTKDQYKGWDGNVAGRAADSNVFVWVCLYQVEGEPVRKEKGTVVLIR